MNKIAVRMRFRTLPGFCLAFFFKYSKEGACHGLDLKRMESGLCLTTCTSSTYARDLQWPRCCCFHFRLKAEQTHLYACQYAQQKDAVTRWGRRACMPLLQHQCSFSGIFYRGQRYFKVICSPCCPFSRVRLRFLFWLMKDVTKCNVSQSLTWSKFKVSCQPPLWMQSFTLLSFSYHQRKQLRGCKNQRNTLEKNLKCLNYCTYQC